MPVQKLFSLDKRLAKCAAHIRKGAKIADIGTDHAYLPVWLAKSGLIKHAIAADINPEPLKKAIMTIEKYGVSNIVEARLSDGLSNIRPNEVNDIVIAGMGGDLISSIIRKALWLRNSSKRLILQPMSKSSVLRHFLCENCFSIEQEDAVICGNHIYTVILAVYNGVKVTPEPSFLYYGKLDPESKPADRQYVDREINNLLNKERGFIASGDCNGLKEVREIISKLRSI